VTKALTDRQLKAYEKAAAPAKREEVPDRRLPGLYLIRQPSSNAMSWAVRYRSAGKPRKVTIGAYPKIDLKAARELGGKALRAAAEGRDPARQKQEAKGEAKRQAAEEKRAERDLFENVAVEFMKRHAVKNTRESSFLETARILGLKRTDGGWDETGNGVIADWKGRKVQEITKRDMIVLLNGIADRAPVMANRTLAALRKFSNWCVGQDILKDSPCNGIAPPAKEDSRKRVLTDDELRLVWNAADSDGYPFGPIVKLMALLGQRENEIARMRRNELDLDGKLWTLQASRTKNNEPHTVPLPDAAVAILKDKNLPKIESKEDFIFAGHQGKPPTAFSHAKRRMDEAIAAANNNKPIPDWVFHDLRRTLITGMARLRIALPVIEKVINHKSGTFRGIVGVYQHHDFAGEKAAALDAWSKHVLSIISGDHRSNVIDLMGAR